MDDSNLSQSRVMPLRHRQTLEEIEGGRNYFDGRSAKLVEALGDFQFIAITDHPDPKNPKKVVVAITERGKNALERSKRGVDPYLVMTK